MGALEELQAAFDTQMLFVESGGDNLAGECASLDVPPAKAACAPGGDAVI